ncbi:MAG: hypothetical protein ACPGIC_07650 [Opitutales bacterium]
MMRRFVCQFYNIVASYPVLAVLFLLMAALLYLGQQYRPLEQLEQAKLAQSMQLKQKRQAMERELEQVEITDLAKRYALFNQNYLHEEDMESLELTEEMAAALEAYGWSLDRLHFVELEKSPDDARQSLADEIQIRGVLLHLEASAANQSEGSGPEFLPLHTLLQAKQYLWRRSPSKEYQKIKISRIEAGYKTEAALFLPLMDPVFSENSNEGDL